MFLSAEQAAGSRQEALPTYSSTGLCGNGSVHRGLIRYIYSPFCEVWAFI